MPHFKLFFSLGIGIVILEILLLQTMQAADTGVAVVDCFKGQDASPGIDIEEDLFVVFRSFILRNLLGNNGVIHHSASVKVSRRSWWKQSWAAWWFAKRTSIRPFL